MRAGKSVRVMLPPGFTVSQRAQSRAKELPSHLVYLQVRLCLPNTPSASTTALIRPARSSVVLHVPGEARGSLSFSGPNGQTRRDSAGTRLGKPVGSGSSRYQHRRPHATRQRYPGPGALLLSSGRTCLAHGLLLTGSRCRAHESMWSHVGRRPGVRRDVSALRRGDVLMGGAMPWVGH